MGLDMYLIRKQRYNNYNEGWDSMKMQGKVSTTIPLSAKNSVVVETEVAYWRKANAIHRWFVGEREDDCRPISVGIDRLEELLELCRKVKATAKVKQGLARGGYGGVSDDSECVRAVPRYNGDELLGFELGEKTTIKNIEEGKESWCMTKCPIDGREEYRRADNPQQVWEIAKVISNAGEVAELLPTQSGFFFGSTDYDEWYLQDIDDTINLLEQVLKEHAELVAEGVAEWDIEYDYQASW